MSTERANWWWHVTWLYSRLDARDRDDAEWHISADVVADMRDMRDGVRAYGKARPSGVETCFGIPICEIKDAPPRTVELWKRIGS